MPVLLLAVIGKPYQRGFYCDDTSIRYPYRDSTVTNVVLYIFSIGLPVVSVLQHSSLSVVLSVVNAYRKLHCRYQEAVLFIYLFMALNAGFSFVLRFY